jgi:hypothetical protein
MRPRKGLLGPEVAVAAGRLTVLDGAKSGRKGQRLHGPVFFACGSFGLELIG